MFTHFLKKCGCCVSVFGLCAWSVCRSCVSFVCKGLCVWLVSGQYITRVLKYTLTITKMKNIFLFSIQKFRKFELGPERVRPKKTIRYKFLKKSRHGFINPRSKLVF